LTAISRVRAGRRMLTSQPKLPDSSVKKNFSKTQVYAYLNIVAG